MEMDRNTFDIEQPLLGEVNTPKLGFFLDKIHPSILGALGSIVGQFVSQGYIKKMNRYNSPEAGAERMRKAGLPLAEMNEQTAGNQSNIPSEGFTGAGEHLSKYAQNNESLMAFERANQMLRGDTADADLKVFDRNAYLSPYVDDNNKLTTLREQFIRAEVKSKKAHAFLTENNGKIASLQFQAQKELAARGLLTAETRARIHQLLMSAKVAGSSINLMKAQQTEIDSAHKGIENLINRFEADGNMNMLVS